MQSRSTSAFARIALALGLLSAVLHAGAFAWHSSVRSPAQTADQALLTQLTLFICHGDGATTRDEPDGGQTPPSQQEGDSCLHCLICKGLSGFLLAILAPVGVEAFDGLASRFERPVPVALVFAAPVLLPRSRGPPRVV